jgi:hypothetical protein
MKKLLAGLAMAGAATLLVGPAIAGAQQQPVPISAPAATVMLLHGIPGATVDVAVNGQVVIPNFEPGDMQDLSSFAGQTLTNVEVRQAGTTTVVIGPIASFPVPASGNVTVVAHLDASGKPTITPFVNDTSSVPAGQGRLVVRHTAAAPAVDIVVGDARPITNLSNPNESVLVLPAGEIAGAKIAPTGGAPIADVPAVTLGAGTSLTVYAVGSLEGNTFTFLTQEIEGLGGAPTGVPTGNAPVPAESISWALVVAAAALALVAGGSLVLARRSR